MAVHRVGLPGLLATLREADLRWVGVPLLLGILLILVSVIKWQGLLQAQGFHVPLARLYALYLVGGFFNQFLPSTVGGDVVRAYELGLHTRDSARATASIFVERLTGFIMLVILALVSLFSSLGLGRDPRLAALLLGAGFALAALLWLLLDPRPLKVLTHRVRLPLAGRLLPWLHRFHNALQAYRSQRGALALALLWSLVFMALVVVDVYSAARAFHRPVPFVEIAAITPILLVAGMAPLTLNGLGLQEWVFVLLFTWIGLPASAGLSAIFLIRLKNLVLALAGGYIYLSLRAGRMKSSVPGD